MSDDIIRLRGNREQLLELFVFLNSNAGRRLLRSNQYGAVVQHLEPHHLDSVPVPILPSSERELIVGAIRESVDAQGRGSISAESAIQELDQYFDNLPRVPAAAFSSVPRVLLNHRLDGSYHSPRVSEVESVIRRADLKTQTLGSARWSKAIKLPGRFRRTFVAESFGRPLIGGKYLTTLDPRNEKHIALDRLPEILRTALPLRPGTLLLSRSGTVGKVGYALDGWAGWVPSDHIIRIEPVDAARGFFLNAFLRSDFGQVLVTRNVFGSVVDELDPAWLANVEVPEVPQRVYESVVSKMASAVSDWNRAFDKRREAIENMNRFLEALK